MPDRYARTADLLADLALAGGSATLEISGTVGTVGALWIRAGRVVAAVCQSVRPRMDLRLQSAGLVAGAHPDRGFAHDPNAFIDELLGLGVLDPTDHVSVRYSEILDRAVDLVSVEESVARLGADLEPSWALAQGVPVRDILGETHGRATRWAELLAMFGGPDARVAVTGDATPNPDAPALSPYDLALLSEVDGTRSIAELAGRCGFTDFEAMDVVGALYDAHLVDVFPAAPAGTQLLPPPKSEPLPVPIMAMPTPVLAPDVDHTPLPMTGALDPQVVAALLGAPAPVQVAGEVAPVASVASANDRSPARHPEIFGAADAHSNSSPEQFDHSSPESDMTISPYAPVNEEAPLAPPREAAWDTAEPIPATFPTTAVVMPAWAWEAPASEPADVSLELPVSQQPSAASPTTPVGYDPTLVSLLTEFAAHAPVAQDAAETANVGAIEATITASTPVPMNGTGADTAALLRELASLGDLTGAPEPGTPATPRPVTPASTDPRNTKKKRGLFGR